MAWSLFHKHKFNDVAWESGAHTLTKPSSDRKHNVIDYYRECSCGERDVLRLCILNTENVAWATGVLHRERMWVEHGIIPEGAAFVSKAMEDMVINRITKKIE